MVKKDWKLKDNNQKLKEDSNKLNKQKKMNKLNKMIRICNYRLNYKKQILIN